MVDKNLYNSHDLAISIKNRAKTRKISLAKMLEDCNLGSNTMSALYHGKAMAFDSLARIADYLDCSVDYLLGRTENPEIGKGSPALSEKEKSFITAYRNKPEMQPAVDKLLGIDINISEKTAKKGGDNIG